MEYKQQLTFHNNPELIGGWFGYEWVLILIDHWLGTRIDKKKLIGPLAACEHIGDGLTFIELHLGCWLSGLDS